MAIISKNVETITNIGDDNIVKRKSDVVYNEVIETKCPKNDTSIHSTPKDINIQYVRFCSNYEKDVKQNDGIHFYDENFNSSSSSSSESIIMRKSILSPISRNTNNLSNG